MVHIRYLLPALIPLLGVTGMICFGARMLVDFIKALIFLFVGRIILPKKDNDKDNESEIKKEERPHVKEAFKMSIKNSKKLIRKILILIIPITLIVFILIDIGVFKEIVKNIGGIASYLPIPIEGLPIICTQFASDVTAYPIAKGLLTKGVLTTKVVVLTLLVGDVLASIVNLRYSISSHFGIFGIKLGLLIVTIVIGLRNIIMLLMIIALAVWW